jgi:signal transduction histidine kinase
MANKPRTNRVERLRFAGPSATSQAVVLPVLLLLSLNSSPLGLARASVTLPDLVALLAVSGGLSWLYFTLGGLALQRWQRQQSSSRATWIILLFATTEMARTSLMHFLALASGIDSQGQWLFRLISAALSGIILFGACSIVLNDIFLYRSAYRSLAEERIRLQTSLTTSGTNLFATRSQTLSSVRSRLQEALLVTLAETRKPIPSDVAVVDELFRIAREVVRPMSHQLFEVPEQLGDRSARAEVANPRLRTILNDATRSTSGLLGLSTVVALFSIPVMLLASSIPRALMVAGAAGFVFLINWLGRRLLAPLLISVDLGGRIALISLFFAFSSAVISLVIYFALATFVELPYLFTAYGVILGVLMGWLVTLAQGLENARNTMLGDAKSINDELYRSNVRAQSQLWVAQKNLAITLHNDVQTGLIAAALQLKKEMASGGSAQNAMPEVRRLLNQALDIGLGVVEERGPEEVLNRANAKWGGLIEASLVMSPAANELLMLDTVAIRIFEDLLVEFMTNSIKHGNATTVKVQVSTENEGTLLLVMANNGSPLDGERTSGGLGSRLLDALTLSHSVTDVPGGVQLMARIPVGAQLPPRADAYN